MLEIRVCLTARAILVLNFGEKVPKIPCSTYSRYSKIFNNQNLNSKMQNTLSLSFEYDNNFINNESGLIMICLLY